MALDWEKIIDVPEGTVLTDETIDAFILAFTEQGNSKERATAAGTYPVSSSWDSSSCRIPEGISFGTKRIPGANPFYFVNQEDEQGEIHPTFGIVERSEPVYDEDRIAVILLDENDNPTSNVTYVDAFREARTILANSPTGSRYWVRMGDRKTVMNINNREFGDYFNPQDRLRLFTMNSSVYTIYASAFQQCVSLKNIVLPRVGSLYSYVFGDCTSLESADMSSCPTRYTGIGTFYNCTSLTEVKLPTGLTEIDRDTFNRCSSLSRLDIPSGVTKIGSEAFYGTAFTKFVVPESVTSIGAGAFAECSNLQEIEIPSGVTSLPDNPQTFYGCTNLTKIIIHKPENSISGAPWGATNATVIWTG